MKIKHVFLLMCCFTTAFVNAQTSDCKEVHRQAILLVENKDKLQTNASQAIELLKTCVQNGDADAQLLTGYLYTHSNEEKKYRKGFRLLKKAAKQDHAEAAAQLGMLYKYGKGCDLNLQKAKEWFTKGAELGNHTAMYSLGYMYLKGFGNTEQNYQKAVEWFQKSYHPMATYWLGVCYYNGYGVAKDVKKANELLNSKDTNEAIVENGDTSVIPNKVAKNVATETTLKATPKNFTKKQLSIEKLKGTWQGKLLKYDWSDTTIEQKLPLTLIFNYDPKYDELKGTWNDTLVEDIVFNNNAIYFDDLHTELAHTSFSKEIPNKINYQVLSSTLSLQTDDKNTYLVGKVESYIKNWKEAGAPLSFVLVKQKEKTNNGKELSDEVIEALAKQKDNFIKVYPNPFESDLVISYTLDTPSIVSVQLTDINGTNKTVIVAKQLQKANTYQYFFEGNTLKKGMYVVTVTTDTKKYTKIIIKK